MRACSKLGFCLVIFVVSMYVTLKPVNKPPRIAIIGAGIAGLTTGYRLSQAGIPFEIYEGSSRAGGRIWSTNLYSPSHVNEMGASFIDSDQEAMMKLVSELGLELVNLSDRELPSIDAAYVHGKIWSAEERFALFEPTLQKIKAHQKDPAASQIFFKMNSKSYLDHIGAPVVMQKMVRAQINNECGIDLENINASYLLDEIAIDEKNRDVNFLTKVGDEAWTIKGGVSNIIDALVNHVGKHIQYDRTLQKISKNKNGTYTLEFNYLGKRVVEIADYVVVTAPLPMLRDGIKFAVGELPQQIKTTIERTIFAQNDKIFFFYQKPFWQIPKVKNVRIIIDEFELHDSTFEQSTDVYSLALVRGGSQTKEPSTEAFVNKIVGALEKIYPGSKKFFVKSVAGLSWPSWIYSNGAYSCKFGPVYYSDNAENKGSRWQNIFFAGEMWGDTSQGYMDSAVQSAERTATVLILEANS
jgi:monoamine oxidase